MDITFVCQSCEDSFDVEFSKLADDVKGVRCPNCGKKLSASELDDLYSTLDDLLGQVSALRKRFLISFDVDAEDLPPPHDAERRRAAKDDDEDEDEDEDDDDDDALGDDDDEPADDDDEDQY